MGKKLTQEQFIAKARSVHGDEYNYDKTKYVNARTEITITFLIHGDFVIIAHSHTACKSGCPSCGKEEGIRKRTGVKRVKFVGKSGFIERSRKKFGDKFDYSRIEYKTMQDKVNIKCPIHGVMNISPKDHLNSKHGCIDCGLIAGAKKQTKSTEDFISEAKGIHGDLYDYSKVNYIGNKDPVEVICKIHGSFYPLPNNHLTHKSGCPQCFNSIKIKREPIYRQILEEITLRKFPKIRPDFLLSPKTGHNLELDGYNEEFKIAFEHQGIQHYEYIPFFHDSIEDFENDQWKNHFKKDKCRENGIVLIIIPYYVPELELRDFISKEFVKLVEERNPNFV